MIKNCLNCQELNRCGYVHKVKKDFLKTKADGYKVLSESSDECPDYAQKSQDLSYKNLSE